VVIDAVERYDVLVVMPDDIGTGDSIQREHGVPAGSRE
jgi:hypothetical protein